MEQEHILIELQKRYNEKKLIPFIGAGLSVPFNLKPWENLVNDLKEKLVSPTLWAAIEEDLKNEEYQGAIDDVKKFGHCTDQTIQEEIADIYNIDYINEGERPDSNFRDLVKDNFKIYLTTNYDPILDWFLPGVHSFSSLKQYTSNTQRLFNDGNDKYVFHIHGNVNNPNSIVISSEGYQKLYDDVVYDDMMKAFSSSHSYLFLGFSFSDIFVQNLLQSHKGIYKGNHYLVISKGSINAKNVIELGNRFGIKILEYDITDSTHILEIRKIMDKISANLNPKIKQLNINQPIQTGVLLNELQENSNHESNLFYKKMEIANINPKLRELCILFYIASEKFIRESLKLGYPKKYIDSILAEVFIRYREKYTVLYDLLGGTSDQLLLAIHGSLEEINIDRYKEKVNFMPTTSETQGFIHILADDGEQQVWWGSERF